MTEKTKSSTESQAILSLEAQIEALLFVAPNMVSMKQIADALGEKKRKIELGIKNLETEYQSRGIRIQRHKGELKLTSVKRTIDNISVLYVVVNVANADAGNGESISVRKFSHPIHVLHRH